MKDKAWRAIVMAAEVWLCLFGIAFLLTMLVAITCAIGVAVATAWAASPWHGLVAVATFVTILAGAIVGEHDPNRGRLG